MRHAYAVMASAAAAFLVSAPVSAQAATACADLVNLKIAANEIELPSGGEWNHHRRHKGRMIKAEYVADFVRDHALDIELVCLRTG